jgi:hypothetical protein
MPFPRRAPVRLAVMAGMAGLLIASLALVWLALARLGASTSTPQRLWATRSFDHYRLVYHVTGLVDCQVDAEVRHESVVQSQTSPAGGAFCALMSVSGLFERVEKLRDGLRCGPNGCECDGPIVLTVDYDRQLGYPTLIERRLRPDLRWQYPGYWLKGLFAGGCTAVGYISSKIEVLSLTALP